MFIGESASWLVIFGFYLYKRFFANSEAPLLYRPIPNGTNDADSDEDEDAVPQALSASGTLHPAAKPLLPNADDRRPLHGWRIVLLAIPACCDITGTTLMNIGLLFVAASIYQMTRGALIIFVGVFSVIFLRRKIYLHQWFALFAVVAGVTLVGLAGAIFKGDKNIPPKDGLGDIGEKAQDLARAVTEAAAKPAVLNTIVGVLLIAFAQVFTASQFCVEEWILENYALEPLKVVAWEGVFGFVVTVLAQIILHFAVGRTKQGRHGYFDLEEGYGEVFHNRTIAVTSVLIMISIGGFNFFGLSVTRSISATSRSIIDTCRTLFIWLVSLGLGWESFKWLQVIGFALLVYGTFLFNDLIRPPLKACLPRKDNGLSSSGLLPEEPIEHS